MSGVMKVIRLSWAVIHRTTLNWRRPSRTYIAVVGILVVAAEVFGLIYS
jgi:hypothetical protein